MKSSKETHNAKKGQQIAMSILPSENTPTILNNLNIEVIDLRKDWKNILYTIYEHQHIQKAMETAY